MTCSQRAELEKQGVGDGGVGARGWWGSPPEACREERLQARWPAGCIIPALRAACDALAKRQARSKTHLLHLGVLVPTPPTPPLPSPSEEPTRVCLLSSTRLCCQHRGWGRYGFSGFTRNGAELGRTRRAGTLANAGGWSRGLGVAR